jgi:Tol biopolymer transport system component
LALTPGARLGPYEIVSALGAGGMGEVYRARDTTLDRDVAIKVLPDAVSGDPERLSRFEREAKALAALNHPNVAQIYAVEAGAIVMELVPGDTLRGPLPMDRALDYAAQIATALDAAHEKGIVHRDLKPGNVMVTPDGVVKVLDFSLAGRAPSSAHADPVLSPTLTAQATQAGVIIGTAAYMAPEQASGKPVDKRADIWAFGVVLWEMLTGRRMFEGETVSHVLAAVLTKDPDLTAVPPRVRHLLARCLEKDPKKRLRDIGDAMSLVGRAETLEPSAQAAGPSDAGWRRWRGVGGGAIAGAMAAAIAAIAWVRPMANIDTSPPIVRFQIERVADIYNSTASAFAVSPDGTLLAHYGASSDGRHTLFVRTLATGELREVPDSTTFSPQVHSVFWSPDSRQLVRGTASGAHVFDLSTGATRALCECRFAGGSWNRDGIILLGAASFAQEGIWRLSATDRTPVSITTIDQSRGEQDAWPVFLPDGRHFFFTRSSPGAGATTYLGTLDGGAPTRIVDGSVRSVVPSIADLGPHLLVIDPAGLVAHAFDLRTMSVIGTARTVVAGAAAASASENGVLTTSASGRRPRTVPTWFDRKGTSLGSIGDAELYEGIALSPDGRRLAAVGKLSNAKDREANDVWTRDLVSGASARITFSPDLDSSPIWSPDGTRIAFSSRRDGLTIPYQKAADGTGKEIPLLADNRHAWPNDWSSDGRWVIYSHYKGENTTDQDLWVVPIEAGTERKPSPYLVTPAAERQAQFSPDGRFVAYGSDESGAWEIYVQPFPNASEGKWMVSRGGGVEPRWSRDGRELFYFAGQTLMAVPIRLRPTFSIGAPAALFDAPIQAGYTHDSHRWQAAPDGRRFLLLTTPGQEQAPPLDVVVNWPAILSK